MQEFTEMVRSHSAKSSDNWEQRVCESRVSEIESFARCSARDRDEVLARLGSPYSNGHVESQGNRQKMIKRGMDGQGNSDLLCKRVPLQYRTLLPCIHQKCVRSSF